MSFPPQDAVRIKREHVWVADASHAPLPHGLGLPGISAATALTALVDSPSASAHGISLLPWALSQSSLSRPAGQRASADPFIAPGETLTSGGRELLGECPSLPSFRGPALTQGLHHPSEGGWQGRGPAVHSSNQIITQPSWLCLHPYLSLPHPSFRLPGVTSQINHLYPSGYLRLCFPRNSN